MDIVNRASDLTTRDFGFGGHGAHIVIPSIAGPLLAAGLVFNRLYWRIRLVRTLGIDDLCIGLSLIFLFALGIVNLVGVNHGYGQPSNSLHPADLQLALQMFYLDQIFYKFTINFTKLSILTLYLRIFTAPWFVQTCWCCFAIVCAYAIASILATVFQCTPINYYWDHHAPPVPTNHNPGVKSSESHPRCINTTAFWLANAIYNISTDIIILTTLPFMIWSLRLPRSQKIGLTFVFGLGIFVFATSILRSTTLESGSKAKDPMVGTVASTMWTMIEASTAVICACLPMCRTPLQRTWPRLFPSKYGSAGGLQTHTPSQTAVSGLRSRRTLVETDSPKVNGIGLANGGAKPLPNSAQKPREMSGGMLAGRHGPGGRTLADSEEDFSDVHFEDLEMQSTSMSALPSRSEDESRPERTGIMGGVVPMRMKRW
ncbi:hypothetical protein EPUS_05734 [Endocarpon pusillum Z07020]|uniref:Rhodopsin domain-containing protein n=1 Tax=Endocarpon pusillum (strain Z07020 / HMAS-L-300199) TaxID=1263415 RepID=U1G9K5_ENDPU|nr:uncharacterized protein EPUS_05734 [Endocarpon pusillum Z07020]ERF68673.1 hypothetical protein EPUS_05734 [Endocarpon pusillum Z07020]